MTAPKGRLDTLLDGVGVRLVPVYRRRKPGQSHARGTMKEIVRDHGEGHLMLTLRLIRESEGNSEALWSETIGAVSDLLASRLDWQERPSELFDVFDALDLNAVREAALTLRPWPVRHTIRAVLFLRLSEWLDRPNCPLGLRIAA